MLIFMLALYIVKALPEVFNSAIVAVIPLTDPAPDGVELDPGYWGLQV